MYAPTKLNQQQLRIVELFRNPWPAEDFDQVERSDCENTCKKN